MFKWGKDKTPTGSFDPSQPFSPASSQAPGFPGTPTYYPQYSAGGFGGPQPGNFGGPQAASPATYANSPMGFNAPQSAGAFGRGQQPPHAQWPQAPPGQNFNNGFSGYQQ
jgi:nucleolysin TIA-1/TIAR